jgi:hypothetical protein
MNDSTTSGGITLLTGNQTMRPDKLSRRASVISALGPEDVDGFNELEATYGIDNALRIVGDDPARYASNMAKFISRMSSQLLRNVLFNKYGIDFIPKIFSIYNHDYHPDRRSIVDAFDFNMTNITDLFNEKQRILDTNVFYEEWSFENIVSVLSIMPALKNSRILLHDLRNNNMVANLLLENFSNNYVLLGNDWKLYDWKAAMVHCPDDYVLMLQKNTIGNLLYAVRFCFNYTKFPKAFNYQRYMSRQHARRKTRDLLAVHLYYARNESLLTKDGIMRMNAAIIGGLYYVLSDGSKNYKYDVFDSMFYKRYWDGLLELPNASRQIIYENACIGDYSVEMSHDVYGSNETHADR